MACDSGSRGRSAQSGASRGVGAMILDRLDAAPAELELRTGWSIEDLKVKQALRARIRSIEARIAHLDNGGLPPPRPSPVTNRLGR